MSQGSQSKIKEEFHNTTYLFPFQPSRIATFFLSDVRKKTLNDESLEMNVVISRQKNLIILHQKSNETKNEQQICKITALIKFELSKKHTKSEKIFLMNLTNQLINLINVKTMRNVRFSKKSTFKEEFQNTTYFLSNQCVLRPFL